MNNFFVVAGALTALVGIVHSVLGEVLIFRRMRRGGLVPVYGGQALHEAHVRIVWASWHVVTVFGFFIASILIRLGFSGVPPRIEQAVVVAVVTTMSLGSLLVLVATKGRHPGWAGLLGVAMLAWLGQAV